MFFYGTLCHVPLLECVLGRAVAPDNVLPASLSGFHVALVQDQPFPALIETPGANADGIYVTGLSQADQDRLTFYEGGFDYDLRAVEVNTVDGVRATTVFIAPPGRWPIAGAWDLDPWIRQWGDLSIEAAREVMTWFGRLEPAEMAKRFDPVRIRAAARLAARARTGADDRELDRDVIVHSHTHPYLNFFAMEEMDLQYRQHDGSMGPVLNRGALMVGQASVVLPYDPVQDRVLLIEQFRAPVFMLGDPNPWVWEPVAGLVDPGETPEQAAHREALEEAGLTLDGLERAGGMYSSTGASAEYLNLFVGLCDLTQTVGTGGVESEGEDIRSEVISFDALMEGVDADLYCDMPLVTLALWLARHHARLRV
ncbi:MAG: NUDIX domain-containing protein [Sedimentitalea sp.]